MDSRSEPPEVVARHQGKAWPTVLKIGLGLLLVLLVAAIALSTLSAPQPVVWLDPAKVVLAPKPPGAIAQLRRKLAILTAPVWQRFRRARPQIMIDSSVMKLSSAAAEGAALGAPTATNTDGLKAWVVSPEQLAALRQRLKNAPGATPLTSARVITLDGSQAAVTVGASARADNSADSIGVSLNLWPKVSSHAIRLQIGATWSGADTLPGTTNLLACRALVPNAGALVVDGGPPKDAAGRSYWFIFYAVGTDARGSPIKL